MVGGWSTIAGTMTVEYVHRNISLPVGTVWYRRLQKGTVCEILYINVPPIWQRIGVGRRLILALLEHFDTLYTEIAANEISEAFMVSLGFVKSDDGYRLTKAKPSA